MTSIFAAPTLVATFFCLSGWGYLTFKNASDRRLIFSISCFFSLAAYIMAFFKYILIFYIDKTPQDEKAMWVLFLQLLCHVTTVLIFCYNYRYSLKR